MKKTKLVIAIALSMGVSGAAFAQFDVNLGGGPGVVAGQGVNTSVSGNISSQAPVVTGLTSPTTAGGEINDAIFGDVSNLFGGITGNPQNPGPGGLTYLNTGSSFNFSTGGTTAITSPDNTASLDATAGTTGGEAVTQPNEFGDAGSGVIYTRAASAGASLEIDSVELLDVGNVALVASASGDTYATLNLDTTNAANAGGSADVDVQQTAVSHIDIDAFGYKKNGFQF